METNIWTTIITSLFSLLAGAGKMGVISQAQTCRLHSPQRQMFHLQAHKIGGQSNESGEREHPIEEVNEYE